VLGAEGGGAIAKYVIAGVVVAIIAIAGVLWRRRRSTPEV
jgi:LPXTG-motif cell wall-anchored protein